MTDLLHRPTVGTELRLVGGTDLPAPRDEIKPIWITVTPAQRTVLIELTRDGATNKVMAHRLGVTEATVKSHIKAVLGKLPHIPDRTALAVALLRQSVRTRPSMPPQTRTRVLAPPPDPQA